MSESSNSLAREPTRTPTVRGTDTTTLISPSDAAETLLRAFFAQDERDERLRAGDGAGAARAADLARDLMGAAFVAEFPQAPAQQANIAGIRFVEALFIQDEIENREALAVADAEHDLSPALFITDCEERDGALLADPRWDLVESYLHEVCEAVNIDHSYATAQTRFWKLHGQQMNWMDAAATAHRIKLRAMLEGTEATEADCNRLADYFVAGVAGHDQWGDDELDAVGGIVGLVTTYYDELFAIQSR